jgi:hypothetical protein
MMASTSTCTHSQNMCGLAALCDPPRHKSKRIMVVVILEVALLMACLAGVSGSYDDQLLVRVLVGSLSGPNCSGSIFFKLIYFFLAERAYRASHPRRCRLAENNGPVLLGLAEFNSARRGAGTLFVSVATSLGGCFHSTYLNFHFPSTSLIP